MNATVAGNDEARGTGERSSSNSADSLSST